MLMKAFDLRFIDLIFLLFPQVGSFKSGNLCTGGQGTGFSSTKDRRDPFLTLLLFGDWMLTSVVSPVESGTLRWGRGGELVLVTQSVFTLRPVPAVLIWPHAHTC